MRGKTIYCLVAKSPTHDVKIEQLQKMLTDHTGDIVTAATAPVATHGDELMHDDQSPLNRITVAGQ